MVENKIHEVRVIFIAFDLDTEELFSVNLRHLTIKNVLLQSVIHIFSSFSSHENDTKS